MRSNDLHNFGFERVGSGCYRVTYTTGRGDYWVARINCMPMIDATLHADIAKISDIELLRDTVKFRGLHYSKNGEIIRI